MTRLFVYGSLKRGHGNNGLLSNAHFVGVGRTVARFRMRTFGFPLLMLRSGPGYRGDGHVAGEIYEVDDATLARLDVLEGVAYGMYRRANRLIAVDGARIKCQVYIADGRRFRGRSKPMIPINNCYNWPS